MKKLLLAATMFASPALAQPVPGWVEEMQNFSRLLSLTTLCSDYIQIDRDKILTMSSVLELQLKLDGLTQAQITEAVGVVPAGTELWDEWRDLTWNTPEAQLDAGRRGWCEAKRAAFVAAGYDAYFVATASPPGTPAG